MLTYAMRWVLALNLTSFVGLFIATGSPEPRFGKIGVILDDWWVISTALIVVMFAVRLFNKTRGNGPGRLWLDVILFGAWICACAVLVTSEMAGFIGF